MKVLVVSHSYVVAMNQEKLELLVQQENISLALVVPQLWVDMERKIYLEKNVSGHYRIYSLKAYGCRHLYFYFYAPLGLFKVLRKERPDIVYLEEEPQSIVALEVTFLSKLLGYKVIIFTWENLKRKFFLLSRWIGHWVLNIVDAVIGGTQRALDVVYDLGYKGSGYVNPQFGLDESKFLPQEARSLKKQLGIENRFVIGFVARLTKEKGIFTLLAAAKKLDFDFCLLILGKGPAQAPAQKMAKDLQIEAQIIWKGIIPHRLVSDYMNCLDIFVLPSIPSATWQEQFGHVLIEAMACEVAVVGSDCGSIPELIGDAGLIFKSGSAEELAVCFKKLYYDLELRQRLAKLGRIRILKEYTHSIIVTRLAKIFREVERYE